MNKILTIYEWGLVRQKLGPNVISKQKLGPNVISKRNNGMFSIIKPKD